MLMLLCIHLLSRMRPHSGNAQNLCVGFQWMRPSLSGRVRPLCTLATPTWRPPGPWALLADLCCCSTDVAEKVTCTDGVYCEVCGDVTVLDGVA